MKTKSILLLTILLSFCFFASPALAGTYQFIPNPSNIYNFAHANYYTWGIDWNKPGEVITDSKLTIANLNNWQVETDYLYIHLLGDAPLGVRTLADRDNDGVDNLASLVNQILLDTYSDAKDWPGPAENYQHIFTKTELTTLNSYASDGRFALGFDPDCHYTNGGVLLTLTTGVVPEPATILLLTTGLLGGLGLKRRRIF